MQSLSQVEAIAHSGLYGDRYSLDIRDGFWQKTGKYPHRVRQVSIFQTTDLAGTGFSGIHTRRNIELSGPLDLRSLLNRQFRLGNVLFEGVWECDPCNRPSKISGMPGYEKLDKEKGGIRAKILEGDILKLGDVLTLAGAGK